MVKEDYVVCYSLAIYDEGLHDVLKSISRRLDIPIINLRNPDTCRRLSYARNVIVDPYQWLGYVKFSSFMVCSSFHGLVFSIIYQKPFVFISPYDNMRAKSLLTALGLGDRYLEDNKYDDLSRIVGGEIDWKSVLNRINMLRADSREFILRALNN